MAAENEEPKRPVKNGPKGNGRKIKVWLAIVLSIVVFILVIQNTQAVTVNILFRNLQVSMIILIPFIFLVGVVAGYVIRRRR